MRHAFCAMMKDLHRRRSWIHLVVFPTMGFRVRLGLRPQDGGTNLGLCGPLIRTVASSMMRCCVVVVFLLACSCVYISEGSSESTSEMSALSQCEATIQDIECSFPLELHITIHDEGCAVVCEPPECPVNNILCINAICSVCLPTTVDLPLEQCQMFLQSCDPMDLGPAHMTTSPSDDGSTGRVTGTGSSTATPDDTGSTGIVDSTGMPST